MSSVSTASLRPGAPSVGRAGPVRPGGGPREADQGRRRVLAPFNTWGWVELNAPRVVMTTADPGPRSRAPRRPRWHADARVAGTSRTPCAILTAVLGTTTRPANLCAR